MNERFSGRKSKDEKSRTDFDYLDRVTDEEIDEAIKDDPDTLTLDDCDMTQLRVVYPKKRVPISLRMESEVLDWYRTHYTHYQTQINAVLKAFKEAQESH